MLDDEVKDYLSKISDPPCIIDDWEELADALSASFDWKGSKIDWNCTQSHKEQCLTGDSHNWILEVIAFIKSNRIDLLILKDDIFYINDSSLDFAICVRPDQFYEFIDFAVCNIPQHHYFFDKTQMWCLVVSMEGYVDFGISRRKHGAQESTPEIR